MIVSNFQCFDINIWNVLCRQILLKSFYNKSSLPFVILIVLQEHSIRHWELAQHGVIIGLIEKRKRKRRREREKKTRKIYYLHLQRYRFNLILIFYIN